MRLRGWPAGILFASSAVACSVLDSDVESQAQDHTDGEPTFAQHPWLWADESEEEFVQNAKKNAWDGEPEFLPSDHPMTQRLQFWVDQRHGASSGPPRKGASDAQASRADQEDERDERMGLGDPRLVERPRALRPAVGTRRRAPDVADAASSDVGVDSNAADGGTDASAAAPPAPPDNSELILESTGRLDSTFEKGFARTHDATSLDEFSRFFSENFLECRVEMQGTEMVFGKGCGDDRLVFARGAKLSYYATGKHVTFTTGYLLQLLDEDRVISTLAHELGHYYRSHTNVPTDADGPQGSRRERRRGRFGGHLVGGVRDAPRSRLPRRRGQDRVGARRRAVERAPQPLLPRLQDDARDRGASLQGRCAADASG